MTFFLADGAPQDKSRACRQGRNVWWLLRALPWREMDWRECDQRFRRKVEAWLDAGLGLRALTMPDVRRPSRDACCELDGDRLLVLAALFVPAHDHLHLEPLNGHELSKVLRGIEGVGSGEPAAGRSLDLLAWRILQERCLGRKPVSPYCRHTAAHPVNAGLKEEEYCIHLGGSEVSVCTI